MKQTGDKNIESLKGIQLTAILSVLNFRVIQTRYCAFDRQDH